MALQDRTKHALADAMVELLKTKELHKIHIRDLCQLSGAERQTFYYHFRDKYELVAWIYLKDLEQSVKARNGIYDQNQLAGLLQLLQQKRTFYRKVFTDQNQNALGSYIYEYNVRGTEQLLQNRRPEIPLTEQERFRIRFFASAWVACMIRWILDPEDRSPEELADLIYQNLPSPLKDPFSDDLPFYPQ